MCLPTTQGASMMYSNKFVMCVLIDGKPVQEFANGEVHIPFGKEYVLRFRNKHNRRASVNFSIDGEDASGAGYIIPPNSYVDIKRYNHRDAAFVLVPLDSPEAVDAGKNGPNSDKSKGVIVANFQLEKKPAPIVREIHHHYRKDYEPWWNKKQWFNSAEVTCSTKGFNASIPNLAEFRPVQDGCTVEGSLTGQSFHSVYFDAESESTTLRIFLKGYQTTEVVQTTVFPTTLREENLSLKKELELLQHKKNEEALRKENEELRRQIQELQNS